MLRPLTSTLTRHCKPHPAAAWRTYSVAEARTRGYGPTGHVQHGWASAPGPSEAWTATAVAAPPAHRPTYTVALRPPRPLGAAPRAAPNDPSGRWSGIPLLQLGRIQAVQAIPGLLSAVPCKATDGSEGDVLRSWVGSSPSATCTLLGSMPLSRLQQDHRGFPKCFLCAPHAKI